MGLQSLPPIERLPNELLLCVAGYLENKDLNSFACVTKGWR